MRKGLETHELVCTSRDAHRERWKEFPYAKAIETRMPYVATPKTMSVGRRSTIRSLREGVLVSSRVMLSGRRRRSRCYIEYATVTRLKAFETRFAIADL